MDSVSISDSYWETLYSLSLKRVEINFVKRKFNNTKIILMQSKNLPLKVTTGKTAYWILKILVYRISANSFRP